MKHVCRAAWGLWVYSLGAWGQQGAPNLEPSLQNNLWGTWSSCLATLHNSSSSEQYSLERVWRIGASVWEETRTYRKGPDCKGGALLVVHSLSAFNIVRPLFIWDQELGEMVPALLARIDRASGMNTWTTQHQWDKKEALAIQETLPLTKIRYKVVHWKKGSLGETIQEGMEEESFTIESKSKTPQLSSLDSGFARACLEGMYNPNVWLYELNNQGHSQWPLLDIFRDVEGSGPYTHTLRSLPTQLLPSVYQFDRIDSDFSETKFEKSATNE